MADVDDPYKQETEANLLEENVKLEAFAWAREKKKKKKSTRGRTKTSETKDRENN